MPPLSVAELIQEISQGRRINILGLEGSASCYALSRILSREKQRTILVVTATEKLAVQMHEAMTLFTAGSTPHRIFTSSPRHLPFTKLPPHPDTWIERIKILHQLQLNELW
jgi:transcription-repair coupling factor (superfamily II helicase)